MGKGGLKDNFIMDQKQRGHVYLKNRIPLTCTCICFDLKRSFWGRNHFNENKLVKLKVNKLKVFIAFLYSEVDSQER